MYTPELHGGVPAKDGSGKVFITPKCPILKVVGDSYVLTGTIYAPGPGGAIVARSATQRWLSLTPVQKDMIVAEISTGAREVWMQETPRMSYPCLLVELSEETAEACGLQYQTRIDAHGTIHENEVAISAELITRELLALNGIAVAKGVEFSAPDLLTVEEGLAAIAKDGDLPKRSLNNRIDADLTAIFS